MLDTEQLTKLNEVKTFGLKALEGNDTDFAIGYRNGINWLYCVMTGEQFIGEPPLCSKK